MDDWIKFCTATFDATEQDALLIVACAGYAVNLNHCNGPELDAQFRAAYHHLVDKGMIPVRKSAKL